MAVSREAAHARFLVLTMVISHCGTSSYERETKQKFFKLDGSNNELLKQKHYIVHIEYKIL